MGLAGSMDENNKRRLVLTLLTRLQCSECQTTYSPHDFTLMHKQSDVWMLEAQCHNCGDTAHVVVAIQVETEVEPVSDLMPEEEDAFMKRPPISTDDVLDIHLLLKPLGEEPFSFPD